MHARRFAIGFVLPLAALAAGATQAATRCETGNLSLAEETACAKAAESTEALRHYVQRTRSMHNLYVWDFVKRGDSFAEGRTVRPTIAQVGAREAAPVTADVASK